MAANLQYRQQLRQKAKHDAKLRAMLRDACHRSFPFWINSFVWTFRQKMTDPLTGEEKPVQGPKAHMPFITWPVQDEFAEFLIRAIRNGEDVAVRKSRDMGATWIIQTVLHWFWQFHPNSSFLELSRKEDLVDTRGDMDSLFEKHRYINKMQPRWLLPEATRDNYMNMENKDNGSSIIGESTNKHAGQGGRKTAVFLDEFGRVDNGEEIALSTADTTACRIFNSTPTGPGTAFQKLVMSGRVQVFPMHWSRHPEKSVGAYQKWDPDKNKVIWTNKWYELECERRDKRDIAQNLDMDFGAAGEVFFDPDEVARHSRAHTRPPNLAGGIKFIATKADLKDSEKSQFTRQHRADWLEWAPGLGRSSWKLWTPLIDGRPPQDQRYSFGVDISNGSGGSNSVISVLAMPFGRVIAEFADSFVSPEDLADECLKAAIWFGGADGVPFIAWENNGPGGIFGRKIAKGHYTRFYRTMTEEQVREKRTPRWGWNSDAKKKEVLLGRLREELKQEKIIIPNQKCLDELLDYVYDDAGKVLPGRLAQETGGGAALHGDRVIATALVILARDHAPRHREEPGAAAPAHSFAWRRKKFLDRLENRNEWSN